MNGSLQLLSLLLLSTRSQSFFPTATTTMKRKAQPSRKNKDINKRERKEPEKISDAQVSKNLRGHIRKEKQVPATTQKRKKNSIASSPKLKEKKPKIHSSSRISPMTSVALQELTLPSASKVHNFLSSCIFANS